MIATKFLTEIFRNDGRIGNEMKNGRRIYCATYVNLIQPFLRI